MRILHVLDHSLPLHSGYTFRTRAIMRAQAARGHVVRGITGKRHYAPGPPAETVDDLDFVRTTARASVPILGEVRALARRVGAEIAAFRPDILHAHSPVLDALAALSAGRRAGVPVLYEIRAFWEDAAVGNGTGREGSARYRATRALDGWTCRRADAVATICDGLRADLIGRGIPPAKIMVSPNGVDLDQFGTPAPYDTALAAELGITPDDDVAGFIGSFYDYEGLDDLIAAMPALVAARPRARLLLVGGGPRADALAAQAAASPVADRIAFVGRVPHDTVERYYSLIDVLVYPRKAMRLTELVTPLKPLEAMAQRRIVAASSVGGHRELIADGDTGTLFAPDDRVALAAAVAGIFARRADWDAQRDRGQAFVAKERNWSSNIARYDAVYDALVARAKG
jgi:glycogen(starch) synthase